MAAVAAIVLLDAQATPVSHTFVPLGPDPKGVWWFEDQSSVNPLGFSRISASLVRPPVGSEGTKSNGRVSRVKLTLYMPVLETVGTSSSGLPASPTVAYVERVTIETVIPERSILLDRKTARKFTTQLLDDALVVAMLESLQNIY